MADTKPRWFVRADLYKCSGKWYAGGQVMIEANPWDGHDLIWASFWDNQQIITKSGDPKDRNYWTVVLNDLPASEKDSNYHTCWKRVLQVAARE